MGRPEFRTPTPRQQEILDWVKTFIHDHGMPPTVREIGGAFEIKSSSVFDLLKALENKGHLRRGGLGARSLIVEDFSQKQECGCVEVRIMGCIRAGSPVEAIEDDHGTIAVKRDLLRGREAFALKVDGTSMVNAGILDGDYVIVLQQETAEDGDVVVALIDGEATLKRLRLERDCVRLDPANDSLRPIYVDPINLRLQGKIVAVHRVL